MAKNDAVRRVGVSILQKRKNNKFMLLWYSYPRIAIALSLIAVNLVVILLFTAILSIVSGNPFFDELAYIFTYTMCSDGIYDFVNSQEDLACFIIKIVLTVIQMVIFSGALIGFTTDILQDTIDKRLNNLGKIDLSDHYVFLNWSSIGAHLIYDLSFLEGKKNVVILSDQDRELVLNSIQNIFTENQKKMKNIRLFIKNGDPNSPKHLSDVALHKAKYVGVLLAGVEDDHSHPMSANDIHALKSLFTIMNVAKDANIVVEAENNDTATKIEQLLETIDKRLNKRIIVFSHNSVLGHILGKTIVHSGFSHLYHSLLSYDGCEFYGVEPMSVEDALYAYNDCIPIVNYDDDDEIDEQGNLHADHLYILSDNRETLGARGQKRSFVKPLPYNDRTNDCDTFSVFIFSHSGNSRFVINELDKYKTLYRKSITCYPYCYSDDLEEAARKIKNTEGIKKILLLSSDDVNVDTQDEDIFLSALAFKLNGCLDENTEIFAEISNPANLNSLRNFGVMSVIVSNRIISLFMVQLLTHPGSKKFYRDLISTNDSQNDVFDLDIAKASDLLDFDTPTLSFSCKAELVQSFYFASNKTRMCIGIQRKGEQDIFFLCDKMDEPQTITISPEDELILIRYA